MAGGGSKKGGSNKAGKSGFSFKKSKNEQRKKKARACTT
jgi:hypothetical protein